jgi:hypothetical protein
VPKAKLCVSGTMIPETIPLNINTLAAEISETRLAIVAAAQKRTFGTASGFLTTREKSFRFDIKIVANIFSVVSSIE